MTVTRDFSRHATSRTEDLWATVKALFIEERRKGVLDVSQVPSSITAHAPGYIDRDREIIVGLQTDAPLKRAIMPNGGIRLVVNALKAYGYTPDPKVVEAFTKYRKTHNEAVFDAYTEEVRRCRSSHILTGLPDAYGRGRIIGDYRRVALYGVDRLIVRKREEKRALDDKPSSDEVIRDREELSEQIRALEELKLMALSYGFDISSPARTAKEAVQWLYFSYLAGVKEQNGAAMSLGRTSTFLDIYFQRDLKSGVLTESEAQEIIDDFVIKLRIIRFLRTPEYDELFAGDPTWVTESIGGMGDDGRSLVTKTSFRMLQTLNNLGAGAGAEPDHLVSRSLPDRIPPLRRQGGDRHERPAVRERRGHAPRLGRRRRDRVLRVADGRRQADAVLRRARQPRQVPALRHQRRARRDQRRTGRPGGRSGQGRVLDFDDVLDKFERMMDWLAGVYVNAMNVIHYMHDKYAYERVEMALHDYAPVRTMAFGIAGMSVVADSLSAIQHAKVRVVRDETGLVTDYVDRGDVPGVRQQRQPRRPAGGLAGEHLHEQAAQVPDLSQRDAHPVGADDHVERGLREGDRQHARRPAARRAVRAGRESDARPRQPRHPRGRRFGRQDSLSRRRRRHLADRDAGARRSRPDPGGSDHQPAGDAGRVLQQRPAIT